MHGAGHAQQEMRKPRVVVVSGPCEAFLFAALVAADGFDVEAIDDTSILVTPREWQGPPTNEVATIKEPHKTHGPQKIGRKGKVKRW